MRFRRTRNQASESIGGQDSFLDIVANLVGILIILVVVVGAQVNAAKDQVVSTEDLDQQLVARKTKLDHMEQQVNRLTVDNHQLEVDISDERLLAKRLADERHGKMMQLELVRQEIQRRTHQWSDYQKQAFNHQVAINSLKQQLTTVQQNINAWQSEDVTRQETIEHFPTPIAKTVFTEEVHFRLSGGKISYVPMQSLIDQMKSQWKVVAENLATSNQAVETVGPIDGYRLQYELKKAVRRRQTERGPVQQSSIQFDHFTVIPIREQLGETVAQAMARESDFQRRLSIQTPERTTISVWVYPDSYQGFADLKKWLHANGFQIASWPLDEGRPISGGPNGFKASAQ